MLMLTLISAELWCALLWALTGAVLASAVALLLGCAVVLASYLYLRPLGDRRNDCPLRVAKACHLMV
jgi:hypothetical protein